MELSIRRKKWTAQRIEKFRGRIYNSLGLTKVPIRCIVTRYHRKLMKQYKKEDTYEETMTVGVRVGYADRNRSRASP